MEASGGILVASWAVSGPSQASWSDLGATRGSLGPYQELLEAILACDGPLRGRITVPEAHAVHPKSARVTPRAPKSAQERPELRGSGPLKNYNPGSWQQQQQHSSTAVSLGALHFVPEARWRIYIYIVVSEKSVVTASSTRRRLGASCRLAFANGPSQ